MSSFRESHRWLRHGFGPGLAAIAAWWDDKQAGQSAIDGLVSLDGTRAQWLAGARDPEHIDPSQYLADQAILDLPGRPTI